MSERDEPGARTLLRPHKVGIAAPHPRWQVCGHVSGGRGTGHGSGCTWRERESVCVGVWVGMCSRLRWRRQVPRFWPHRKAYTRPPARPRARHHRVVDERAALRILVARRPLLGLAGLVLLSASFGLDSSHPNVSDVRCHVAPHGHRSLAVRPMASCSTSAQINIRSSGHPYARGAVMMAAVGEEMVTLLGVHRGDTKAL